MTLRIEETSARLTSEESERPSEWLRRLEEDEERYRVLLAEVDNIALAAYRLARARCRTSIRPSDLPTVSELRAAAKEIQRHTGAPTKLPISSLLVAECEAKGMVVITPIAA